MNVMLLVAGLLSILIGFAHSLLGERLVLGPLFRRGDLPRLLGSRSFARQTLRFTWHVTTVLLAAIGVIVIVLSRAPGSPDTVWILRILAITFGISSLVSLAGAKGKHFSWWVFLVIALLLWFGA